MKSISLCLQFPILGSKRLNSIRKEVDDDNDDSDDVVLIPQAVDISYPKLAVDETHVQLYEKANCSILQVEVSDAQFSLNSVHEGLCFELANLFFKHNKPIFRLSTFSSWGPEDVPFKELAFVLLFLTDRYSFSLLPSSSPSYAGDDTDVGVTYPTTSSFWFAGAFVYLTTHLKDDAVRKSAIGHVLELTKNCPRSNFTAFLFSICELVVIDISEEGIKHTETLPFFDIVRYQHDVGLLAMITSFTRSRRSFANYRRIHRAQTLTSPSSLPYDILLNIVKYVGWETTITLSATSKLLRECVERLGPKLVDNFQLLKYDAHANNFLARRDGDALVKIKIQPPDPRSDVYYPLYMKIRYPGVRQVGFIPPLIVKELDSAS